MEPVRVSVRAMVEWVLRAGDLVMGFGSGDPVEGQRVHKWIQKSRPEGYRAEVPVSLMVEAAGLRVEVMGRMDGLMERDGRVIVEEIKSTGRNIHEALLSPDPLHWAQVKVYAYIYARQNGLDEIDAQLTYCRRGERGETREIRRTFSLTELETFFSDLVERWATWAARGQRRREERLESADRLGFPYPAPRAGQMELADAVREAVSTGGRLLAQAPTGLGKTMAVLYGTLRAGAGYPGAPVFYLTARTTGRLAAEDAAGRLRAAGAPLRSVTVTARDKICPHPETACTPDECDRARGHYDRIHAALEDAWDMESLDREAVSRLADRHAVCPFELSLDLALMADLCICDYNYVFDPRVFLRRFFMSGRTDSVFLVDEAHNLVDRARDMHSAQLTRSAFIENAPIVHDRIPAAFTHLEAVVHGLDRIQAGIGPGREAAAAREAPGELIEELEAFNQAAREWLADAPPSARRDRLLELFFRTTAFVRTAEGFGDHYVVLSRIEQEDLIVSLFCLDPSVPLGKSLDKSRATVFFSATLSPEEYYRDMLGAGADAGHVVLPSPMPPENLGVFTAPGISTYYRNRQQTKSRVARAVRDLAAARKGNYIAYFPSYGYMEMVRRAFLDIAPDTAVLSQHPGMSEWERESFLNRFRSDNPETLVGFAVLGGFFGEGIDLAGERLTGAVIVGPGLPGIDAEREMLREYFNEQGLDGFRYAYLFPGLTRVFQAAGRVIRTQEDRGVVLLIDPRFASTEYEELFPPEWTPMNTRNGEELTRAVEYFWAS